MAKQKIEQKRKTTSKQTGRKKLQSTSEIPDEVLDLLLDEEKLEEYCRMKRNASYKRLHNGLEKNIELLEKIRDGEIEATSIQKNQAAKILLNKVLPDRTYKEITASKNEKSSMEIRLMDLTDDMVTEPRLKITEKKSLSEGSKKKEPEVSILKSPPKRVVRKRPIKKTTPDKKQGKDNAKKS